MTIGEKIKNARIKSGMTQAELANILGIPYQSISQWERGLRNPKYDTLQKIATALDTPIDSLFSEESQAQYDKRETLGNRIKRLRKAANLTQKQFAKKLGVSVDTIQQYESGKRVPQINMIEKISDSLNIESIELFTGKPQEKLDREAEQEVQKAWEDLEEVFWGEFSEILFYYKKLNDHGKSIAVERVAELSKIPDYQKKQN